MPTVLVASDAAWVRDQVKAALVGPNFEVIEVTRGQDVRQAVDEYDPDLVIVDLQIGNMGGMAVSLDLRLEESADRLPYVPILLLLDREGRELLFTASRTRQFGVIDGIRLRCDQGVAGCAKPHFLIVGAIVGRDDATIVIEDAHGASAGAHGEGRIVRAIGSHKDGGAIAQDHHGRACASAARLGVHRWRPHL